MTGTDIDIIAEVRRNRELLLEIYGGIDGLHKHMDDSRPELERQGRKFISADDVLAEKRSRANAVTVRA